MLIPYYEEENITIYHGDCLEVMPQLTQKFDAIIADLPYGTTACEWDKIIDLDKLWLEYKRLIKDNGPIVLFGNQPFTTDLVLSNRNWYKYNWYWKKERGSGFQLANYQPLRIIEDILIFGNSSTSFSNKLSMVYNPQKTALKTVYKHVLPRKKIKGIRTGLKTSETGEAIYNEYTHSHPINLIEFARDIEFHPNQKPLALMQYLIKTYTNEGDIILDNTMGSGTTLVAAKIERRKAVGIELKEKYCQDAVQRLKEVNPFYQKPSKKKDTPYEGFDMEKWLNE